MKLSPPKNHTQYYILKPSQGVNITPLIQKKKNKPTY